ncbi:hypothetical protein [Plantactinospora sp. GCM10030261]|uniref:hypothetical protein n=1 Tax=Plantactinospora sp. GCM10030261 TaxID=3273420 RepID=UPI00361F4360
MGMTILFVAANRRAAAAGAIAVSMLAVGAGCAAAPAPAQPPAGPRAAVDSPAQVARDQLAARVAAAADQRLTASYVWSAAGRPDRVVTVAEATDGGWRVDIPGGALDGTVDVAIIRTGAVTFQCTLFSTTEQPTCVRPADPDGTLPTEADPEVHHVFTDWQTTLLDRRAPLAVSVGQPPPGVDGDCFAVGSTSASLAAPLAVGRYCYHPDGTLTGARLDLGTLRLAGPPTAGPATIELPGPVVLGEPLPVGAPAASTTAPLAD